MSPRTFVVLTGFVLLATSAADAAEATTSTDDVGQARCPWQPMPSPPDAAVRPYRCRIVSYADKWTRHGLSNYIVWRYPNGPLAPHRSQDEMFQISHDLDVDGDGATDDDYVASLPFSLSQPLSNPDWPMHMAFPERRNHRFYGGVSWYVANSSPDEARFWVEMGYNPDHSPPWFDPRAEDHPLQGQANEHKPESAHRHYWAILWRKPDFMNGGDRWRVAFDETSRLAAITTRDYWLGYDDVRMIVQDREGLWISDNEAFDIPTRGYKPARGRVFLLYPAKATWAPYEPKGHLLHFDHRKAEFRPRTFRDVRAVGWYLGKDRLQGKQSHLKWYGFEADAVVHRPRQGSVHAAMAEVPAGKEADGRRVPPFWMGTCEVPYALWKDVYRYGDAPFHTLEARYVYRNAGDMGSMRFGRRPHGPDEPATNVPLYDVLAWCNTLSEMEGKTPCYYVDPAFREVFRNMHIATRALDAPFEQRNRTNPTYETVPPPTVYVRWNADGHRLPTPAEWRRAFAAGRSGGTAPHAWTAETSDGTTHPVGTGAADALGLHDMIGNVWELVWPWGDAYDPAEDTVHLTLGGGFLHPTDPRAAEAAASPYGDVPSRGHPSVGVRLVCREAGLPSPPTGPVRKEPAYAAKPVPQWAFGANQRTAARQKPDEPAKAGLDLVGLPGGTFVRRPDQTEITVSPLAVARTHTTYTQWRRVFDWAEAHGYRFSRTGNMGSMYFFRYTHGPDEPVTHITWHDAVVWCNALSEVEGRTPCYYTDQGRSEVYRHAFTYRPLKVSGSELVAAEPHRYAKYSFLCPQPWLWVRWDADGYRLPTLAEYEYAVRGGTDTRFFWGKDPAGRDAHTWNILSADGRTHPVGAKQPNPFGLHDIQGNAYHWLWSIFPDRITTRPPELDTRNPKADPYWPWGQPKEVHAPHNHACIAGGSWLCGGFDVNRSHGVLVDSQNAANTVCYYPDLGFRVVRCKAGTHPRDGKEPMREWPTVLDIDPDAWAPVPKDGAVWRADLCRTGAYSTRGVPDLRCLAWKADTGGAVRSSPVVCGGVVYVGSDGGHFHAFDAATGRERWRLPVKGGVRSSACVAEGTVYFGGNDGQLYAVDAKTGEVRWKVPGSGRLTTSPAVAHGIVFMEGSWGFDVGTGEQVWSTTRQRLRGHGRNRMSDRLSSLAVWRGWILHNGSVLDIRTAQYRLGRGDPWAGQNCDAFSGGTLFTLNSGVGGAVNLPRLDAIDAEAGRKRWSRDIVAPDQPVSERKVCLTSPCLADGKVMVGFDGGVLFAFDAATGKTAWTFKTGEAIRSSASASVPDDTVYVGCHDGNLYAIDARSGKERWRFRTGGKVASSPCVAEGAVFVGSDDGHVYALH